MLCLQMGNLVLLKVSSNFNVLAYASFHKHARALTFPHLLNYFGHKHARALTENIRRIL